MVFLPKQVVILRHGEKPGDAALDEAGGDPDLSLRGHCRAAALAVALPAQFGTPDLLIATQASASSNRPVETITPLATALRLPIDDHHGDKDYAKVAQDLLQDARYQGRRVVVCWHHGRIPALATALGVTPPVAPWPAAVFDRYWVITADAAGAPQVANLPQRLLFGDDAA